MNICVRAIVFACGIGSLVRGGATVPPCYRRHARTADALAIRVTEVPLLPRRDDAPGEDTIDDLGALAGLASSAARPT